MNPTDPDTPADKQLPEWLRQQQHNSWQIEMLIASGSFINDIPFWIDRQ